MHSSQKVNEENKRRKQLWTVQKQERKYCSNENKLTRNRVWLPGKIKSQHASNGAFYEFQQAGCVTTISVLNTILMRPLRELCYLMHRQDPQLLFILSYPHLSQFSACQLCSTSQHKIHVTSFIRGRKKDEQGLIYTAVIKLGRKKKVSQYVTYQNSSFQQTRKGT